MAQERYTTLIIAGDGSPKAVVKAIVSALHDHATLVQASTPE